ncbi:MAG TPA: hypothetical protein PK760_08280 [Flavobacteriales bacterium]|nr:hypothetical protein [Flavobacteriales bacterium]
MADRSWVVLVACVGLALVLHAQVLGLSFFSDDFQVLHRLGVDGELSGGTFFRPLPDLFLWLNYLVAGPTPWAFRVINVMLLGVNGWLLFLLARKVLMSRGVIATSVPPIAALLFVCYPFHTEPQLWIIGRGIAMATAFTLWCLITVTGAAATMKKAATVFLLTSLGLLCYESAFVLPLLLMVLLIGTPERRPLFWAIGASVLAVGLNLLLRVAFTGHVINDYGAAIVHNAGNDLFDRALGSYLRLFFQADGVTGGLLQLLASLPVLLVIVLVLRHRLKKLPEDKPVMSIVVLWLLVCVCTAAVGGTPLHSGEGSRFMYMPSAFLCMTGALALVIIFRRAWLRACLIAVLVVLGIGTIGSEQANWAEASSTIERIVSSTPVAPANARLFVTDLPGEHDGAYIFRHGYIEALLFAGRDTSGVHWTTVVNTRRKDQSIAVLVENNADTLLILPTDTVIRWKEGGFVGEERDLIAP